MLRYKVECAEPLEETPLKRVPRAVWAMLYAGDTRAWRAGRQTDFARMVVVIVVVCQEFRFSTPEREAESLPLWSVPSSAEAALHVKAAGRRS